MFFKRCGFIGASGILEIIETCHREKLSLGLSWRAFSNLMFGFFFCSFQSTNYDWSSHCNDLGV
jgi:hypothetical protein